MKWLRWLFYYPVNKLILLRHDYYTAKFNENYIKCIQTQRRLEFLLKQKKDV